MLHEKPRVRCTGANVLNTIYVQLLFVLCCFYFDLFIFLYPAPPADAVLHSYFINNVFIISVRQVDGHACTAPV